MLLYDINIRIRPNILDSIVFCIKKLIEDVI